MDRSLEKNYEVIAKNRFEFLGHKVTGVTSKGNKVTVTADARVKTCIRRHYAY